MRIFITWLNLPSQHVNETCDYPEVPPAISGTSATRLFQCLSPRVKARLKIAADVRPGRLYGLALVAARLVNVRHPPFSLCHGGAKEHDVCGESGGNLERVKGWLYQQKDAQR